MKKDSQNTNQNTANGTNDYSIDSMNDALEFTNEINAALSPRRGKKPDDREKNK